MNGKRLWLLGGALVGALGFLLAGLMIGDRPPVAKQGTRNSAVTVFGQVATQGKLTFTDGMTAKDAVSASGGVAQFANTRRVRIANPAYPEPFATQVVRWVAQGYNGLAEGYNRLVDVDFDLPFDLSVELMTEPPHHCRVMVDLERGQDAKLLPGDVVIVPEKVVTF